MILYIDRMKMLPVYINSSSDGACIEMCVQLIAPITLGKLVLNAIYTFILGYSTAVHMGI